MPEKYHFMNLVVTLATNKVLSCGYTDFTLHTFFDPALHGVVVVGVPLEDQSLFSGVEYLHVQETLLALDIQATDWYWNDTTSEFQETAP